MLTSPREECSICSWETGTLVFATLNLITWALGVLGGVAGFILIFFPHWNRSNPDLPAILIGFSMLSGFLMVFAVLLFHGVLKKNPHHIKAYFVFGACMLGLNCFGWVASATFLDGQFSRIPRSYYWDPTATAMNVAGQVIYGLILGMIYKTYKKMETAAKHQDEQKNFLIENMNEKFVMPSNLKV